MEVKGGVAVAFLSFVCLSTTSSSSTTTSHY